MGLLTYVEVDKSRPECLISIYSRLLTALGSHAKGSIAFIDLKFILLSIFISNCVLFFLIFGKNNRSDR